MCKEKVRSQTLLTSLKRRSLACVYGTMFFTLKLTRQLKYSKFIWAKVLIPVS